VPSKTSVVTPNLSIKYLSKAPKIIFIIVIGIKVVGSCHPMMNARGMSRINDIVTPLTEPFRFNSVLDMKKPVIT